MRDETKNTLIEKYGFSDWDLECVERLFHKGNFSMKEAAETVHKKKN